MQVAGNAAVAALFLASAGGALANLFTSFYRVYGALAGACALRGAAYALRAAGAVSLRAAYNAAWWPMTAAGLGFALSATAAALSSWYRNAKATSKPACWSAWAAAAQGCVLLATIAGPALGTAAAGLAHGARTTEVLDTAAGVKAASAWGLVAAAALLTLIAAVAAAGTLLGFPEPPVQQQRMPGSSSGGSSGGGSSGGGAPAAGVALAQLGGTGGAARALSGSCGGGAAAEGTGAAAAAGAAGAPPAVAIGASDVEQAAATSLAAITLGEPVNIVAEVIDEDAVYHALPPTLLGRAAGLLRGRSAGLDAARRAGGDADLRVWRLLASAALLLWAAVARAAALGNPGLWADDLRLLPLLALPELLSAALLCLPPAALARAAMASRYAQWQPRKGKPPTSRPRNSNPALWKRAGLPAPASRTHTASEGG